MIVGVSYSTIILWTPDITTPKGRSGIRGKSLEFLKLLVGRGYVLGKEVKHFASCMRNIKKYLPIKRVDTGRNVIWYLVGREREAMEALLKSMNRRSIGYGELGMIRKAFGIKNMKANNKIERVK